MKIGDANSLPLPITCGVPQGSILGPVLFNIAINDILLEFQSSFAYADDTLLYCTANSIIKVIDLSQRLLIDAAQWYNRNLLTLNINKTQFCIFSNRKIKEYYHITHGNTNIE